MPPRLPRRSALLASALVSAAAALPDAAGVQAFPNKPVRAGGGEPEALGLVPAAVVRHVGIKGE